ncbi:MAG TPA: aspartate-semialdehyde dehydrogenase [Vicinamibacteria bacterium]|nr:aspartate-semialdehyde dehydrogenase [Vicinamibacteria bacterium]
MMRKRVEVGVLGATGMVGQQFINQLANHPWFELAWLAASERSEGKRYADAAPWRLETPLPEGIADRAVEPATPGKGPRLVFSALDAGVAGELERAFAEAGHLVVSNARNHRMDPTVPLLVPEVNAEHLALLRAQAKLRGGKGAIVTNPNCSTVVLTMALAPLRPFGLRSCLVSTMQAVSGAGYPGVASLDILGNVIPFIAGEEEKIESETRKILGSLADEAVELHPVRVSAHTSRVPVVDGHTETVAVALEKKPSFAELRAAFEGFSGAPQRLGLPSAPERPILYLDQPNRPQPRFDAARGRGMAVSVGRLRPCPVLDWKFVTLGHNTVRGAAGAAVLNAELMQAEGLLD